jgi:hypothetical protein
MIFTLKNTIAEREAGYFIGESQINMGTTGTAGETLARGQRWNRGPDDESDYLQILIHNI